MNQRSLANDDFWQRLVAEFADGQSGPTPAREEFFRSGTNRVAIVRRGLRAPDGNSRATAISLLQKMKMDEKKQLYPELMQLARAAHGPVGTVREIILTLPPTWLKSCLKKEVEAILREEQYDDYWMMLELYQRLDPMAARKLAHRAADSPIAEIRELAADFLTRLPAPPPRARR